MIPTKEESVMKRYVTPVFSAIDLCDTDILTISSTITPVKGITGEWMAEDIYSG